MALSSEFVSLVQQEIPEGRQSLSDSHANLEKVASYCIENFARVRHPGNTDLLGKWIDCVCFIVGHSPCSFFMIDFNCVLNIAILFFSTIFASYVFFLILSVGELGTNKQFCIIGREQSPSTGGNQELHDAVPG